MKKIIISLLSILLIGSLVACSKENNEIVIEISESTKFSEDEINSAINCVKDNFSFPAATLEKIIYDEEKGNSIITTYLEHGNGSINGISSENVIALLANFYVDDSGDNPVLNRDTTYTNYQWILIRDSETSDWKIDSFGF